MKRFIVTLVLNNDVLRVNMGDKRFGAGKFFADFKRVLCGAC